ncbi:hypothetical protein [Cupriavidus sp. CuC1]|uniref:hypothetical protein n=1 Tax=Cupriavidus sp. CuC1 TaxID=3373131 RepID=UPI0037CD610D
MADIASAPQAEFAKVAEAKYEEHKRKMQDLIDNAAKGTPAGSVSRASKRMVSLAVPPRHDMKGEHCGQGEVVSVGSDPIPIVNSV